MALNPAEGLLLNGGTVGPLAVGEEAPPLASAPAREWLLPGADEIFRGIYTRSGVDGTEVLGISSAIAGEGKTTIGLGLGVTIAQDYPERRIAFVETDFERPSLANDFDLEPSPGLMDCLLEDLPIQTACRASFLPNLHLVPVGGPITNAGRWLRSARMTAAVGLLRQSYNLVILDLPALLVNSDSLLLTDLVDGMLLVVRAGATPTFLVNKAIAQLDDSRALLHGVVLNEFHSAMPSWLRRACGLS
jgi:Mrp family chromosome partitioning ATPase